jgi:hypothetical protein
VAGSVRQLHLSCVMAERCVEVPTPCSRYNWKLIVCLSFFYSFFLFLVRVCLCVLIYINVFLCCTVCAAQKYMGVYEFI